jgi:translation initiation factor 2 subunit 1
MRITHPNVSYGYLDKLDSMEKNEKISKPENLPLVGEFVVVTINRIVPYGAYATLDEYDDAEGLLHISEISSRWVRNIRNHVRENQKTILKVLRVDPEKRHINLSLRRVTEREKRERLLLWKHDKRGQKLFDRAIKRLGVDREEAMEKVGDRLKERFGSLYTALEVTVMNGEEALTEIKIPSNWVKVLSEIAESRINIPLKKVRGDLKLTCTTPNGVEVLRDAFKKITKIKTPDNANIDISIAGVPRYHIEVLANSYPEAEELLEKAVHIALETIEEAGGEGEFTRR